MKQTAVLTSPQQAHVVLSSLWASIKQQLNMGQRLTVEVKPEARSTEQNRKFHAICRDFARAGAVWAGKPRTEQGWKVLLISGHAIATGEGAEVLPGLRASL